MVMRYFSLGIMIIFLSCTSVKMSVDAPKSIVNQSTSIKVSKVKGKLLPGASRTLEFDKEFIGKFKDGWKLSSDKYDKTPGGMFSEESIKRSFLLNFGIGINDVISKTSDKFQFTISDNSQSLLVFCHQLYLGKSKSYQIKEMFEYSKGERQLASFTATMNIENDTVSKPWLLQLGYDRETPDGIVSTIVREGMAREIGTITNQIDTIHITPLFISHATSSKGSHVMPFSVIGGYEFKVGEKVIGWVDLYNTTVGLSNSIFSNHKLIITAASTAIFLRNR
jgi:hypothetical protein